MKITLNSVGNLIDATTAAANINANNLAIQTGFENTLSRDGTAPNQMSSNLDMNSNRIVNLPVGVSSDEPVTVGTLNAAVIGEGNVPLGGTTGQVLAKASNADFDDHWINTITSAVTSVGLALPADFTVTNSPVTTTGTLTGAWATTPTGTGAIVRATNPTFPGNIATGTVNNVILVAAGSTPSLTLGSGKTVAVNNSLTLAGTDGTTQTFPTTNATIARTDAAQTFTGAQTFSSNIVGNLSGNATTATTASTVTTNANLTGAVTSTGNATSLGSFTSANLRTALTDETGTGAAVFATSPALVTPTGIVKGDVGLGNVDNTSDATKNAAVKTLTNTTYDTAGTGNSFSINGVAATANTGTGSVVRATSPTLVTPVLGAATATTINGAALDNTAWTTYTPTISSTAGSLASTLTTMSAPATGRYKQIGKTVICQINCGQVTVVGTASGNVIATAPVAAVAGQIFVGASIETNLTGRSGGASIGAVGASSIACRQADTTTYWTLNYNVIITITYEAA